MADGGLPGFLVDLQGFARLKARLEKIGHSNPIPLMISWMKVIDDDTRKGVMAGLDKDGVPMLPVTYRPVGKAKKPTPQQKNVLKGSRLRRGAFGGFGPHAAGLNNNLTKAEYERLNGPPLAPRGTFSRVITNLKTRFGKLSETRWEAVGYWDEVVTAKGRKFLHYHFEGWPLGKNGPTKRRDLRGVRPDGMAKARHAAVAWMRDAIRSAGAMFNA
jgi:hypothetical protein